MNRPTREDPLVEAVSEVIGGPVGDRARPHRWWTPLRVLLAVFTVVCSLSLVRDYPCAKTEWSDESVRYGRMCYSDVPYLYTGRGFAEQEWPYDDDSTRYPAMEYPVLISYFAWVASEVTALMPAGPSGEVRAATEPGQLWGLPGMSREVNIYVLVTAILLFAFGLGSVFFMSGASPGRPWDAMPYVLSPVLLAAALVNWDLVAVFFTAGALWAWARGKPVLAGVMVGLGTAAKLYPLFLLGAFLVDLLRRRRPDLIAPVGVAAVGAWLLVNLPAMVTGPGDWKLFWTFNSDRGADLGSLWLVASQLGANVDADLINAVSGVLFAAACAGIFALAMIAPKRPQVAQVAFLVVAAFLLVNKVYSPQYVLWLLPLAVLARPRWRDLLIWQAGELLYFGAVWLYLGGWLAPYGGTNPTAYQLAILIRVAAEIYLMVVVVREMLLADPDEEVADDWQGSPPGSADGDVVALPELDLVEGSGRVPDPDLDLVTDGGHRDA